MNEKIKPEYEEEDVDKQTPSVTVDGVATSSHTLHSYWRSLSHISESSADGVVLMDRPVCESEEVMSLASGISINDIEMAIPSRSPEPAQVGGSAADVSQSIGVIETNSESTQAADEQPVIKQQATSTSGLTSPSQQSEGTCPNSPSHTNAHPDLGFNTCPDVWGETYVARRVPVVEEVSSADWLSKESDGPGDNGLKEALAVVLSSLDDYRGQFPEIQLLEQELKSLQVTLKVCSH